MTARKRNKRSLPRDTSHPVFRRLHLEWFHRTVRLPDINCKVTRRMDQRLTTAIGVISGTSMDGIDVALIETDGRDVVRPGEGRTMRWPEQVRERLLALLADPAIAERDPLDELDRQVTGAFTAAIAEFMTEAKIGAGTVDLIGLHGQTVWHRPERRFTRQLGLGGIDRESAWHSGGGFVSSRGRSKWRARRAVRPAVSCRAGGGAAEAADGAQSRRRRQCHVHRGARDHRVRYRSGFGADRRSGIAADLANRSMRAANSRVPARWTRPCWRR